MTAPVITRLEGAVASPARNAVRDRGGMARRRRRTGILLVLPALVMLLTFFIWPLMRTIAMSTYTWPLLGNRAFTGLANYVEAFQDAAFLKAVGFTLVYTAVVTPVLLVIGLLLVLLIQRRTRTARIFQSIYFLPVVVGLASASYLFLFMWQPVIGPTMKALAGIGLVDVSTNMFGGNVTAFLVVVSMVAWKSAGLQMLLLLSGFQSIPQEVNEAAEVDGSTRWQRFFHITLPLLRPTLALVLVFSVAGSLLAFDQFYIMTAGGPDNGTITAVYEIYRSSFIRLDLGYGAALSIILMVVLGLVSAAQMLLLRNSDHS
ncbi:sn-glycerol-3-phosphate transport system permease protein UgpA [Clavibacter michiganensis]|nr:sn-glycerol-3-phosphate transport system permease protein UgpA [Clavibacter michiganensis]